MSKVQRVSETRPFPASNPAATPWSILAVFHIEHPCQCDDNTARCCEGRNARNTVLLVLATKDGCRPRVATGEALTQQEHGSMAAEVTIRGAHGLAEWEEEMAGEEGERRQIAQSIAYAQANG